MDSGRFRYETQVNTCTYFLLGICFEIMSMVDIKFLRLEPTETWVLLVIETLGAFIIRIPVLLL